jgi:hypothetical protein
MEFAGAYGRSMAFSPAGATCDAMIPEASISILRLALRMSNGFVLDLLKLHRGERDFADALILATFVQCNSAPVAGRPDLQQRYAGFATPVPEAMGRTISINAVAASLGMPFETVRRRTKTLIGEGLCEATANGVRLADAYACSPQQHAALSAAYALTRGLYLRLVRASCVQPMELPPLADPCGDADEPPVRIVWRTAADFLLRAMELLLPRFTSLTRVFVVLAVSRANTEHLPDTLHGEEGVDARAMVPDEFRRPVRASEVAARLGLPHETVRRNLAEETAVGRCRRVSGGFIVPAEVLAQPYVLAASGANYRNLTRMFGELAETGVLARWNAEAAADESAA